MRRRGARKVAGEVVPAPAHHVLTRLAIAVVRVRIEDEIEVLVRLNQCVDQKQGGVQWNVIIHRSVREQQMALQVLCVVLIRLRVVVGAAVRLDDLQTAPLLCPVVFVLALIVVAGLGDADLEEVGIAKHRGRRRIAAAGVAPDTDVIEVDEGVFCGQFLDAGNLVGQRVVGGVARVEAHMKGLRAFRRADAVDADDDEAKFGKGLIIAMGRREAATAAARANLRAGIDKVNDRIFFARVERGGLEQVAVEIGLAVARLHGEGRERLPAGGKQRGQILPGQRQNETAGLCVAQGRDLRGGWRGGNVDEQRAIIRDRHGVGGVVGSKPANVFAGEVRGVEVLKVGVLAGNLPDREV